MHLIIGFILFLFLFGFIAALARGIAWLLLITIKYIIPLLIILLMLIICIASCKNQSVGNTVRELRGVETTEI